MHGLAFTNPDEALVVATQHVPGYDILPDDITLSDYPEMYAIILAVSFCPWQPVD